MMIVRQVGFFGLVAGLIAFAGCGGGSPSSSESTSQQQSAEFSPAPAEAIPDPSPAPPGQSELVAAESTGAVPAAAEVSLQILSWDKVLEMIAQNKGKVVVVDLWATYCPPCIAEFPHLVKLDREKGDQVKCISVSLDYDGFDDMPPESYREKILAFLQKQQATMTNVLCATDSETMFNEKLEHKSIPVVYVYNKSGELAGQFPDPKNPDEFTYAEHVLPLVEQLLAQ